MWTPVGGIILLTQAAGEQTSGVPRALRTREMGGEVTYVSVSTCLQAAQ